MAPCPFKLSARFRSRLASPDTARLASRRAAISRADSLTRTSPARTELPSPTRISATVPLIRGAMVALRTARTVPTTSLSTGRSVCRTWTMRTVAGGC